MPNKISVVIADDNIEFAEIVKNFLSSKGNVEVQGIAPDRRKSNKFNFREEARYRIIRYNNASFRWNWCA